MYARGRQDQSRLQGLNGIVTASDLRFLVADSNQLKETLIIFRVERRLRLADKDTHDPLPVHLIDIMELSCSDDFSDALEFHGGLRECTFLREIAKPVWV
jgi:hypothetical protein